MEMATAEAFGEDGGVRVAKDISGWIKDFDHVEATVYNPSKENPEEPPVINGKLHAGAAKAWTKKLTPGQTDVLISCITGEHDDDGGAGCFLPHHGFIFYDKDSKILGYLCICFMCGNYHAHPEKGLSAPWDLGSIRKLATDLGLPMLNHPDEWAAFFADKAKLERGPEKAPESKQ